MRAGMRARGGSEGYTRVPERRRARRWRKVRYRTQPKASPEGGAPETRAIHRAHPTARTRETRAGQPSRPPSPRPRARLRLRPSIRLVPRPSVRLLLRPSVRLLPCSRPNPCCLWWTLARTTREQTKKSTAVQVLLDNKNKENYGTVVVSEVGPDVFATQKHKNK